MTKDHDFKHLVRERMAKTGESYAAARRQLRSDLDDTTLPGGHDRHLLVVHAEGNVDIAGSSGIDALDPFGGRGRVWALLAQDRRERKHVAARDGLWPGPAVDLGLEAVGGHGIQEVEVEGDTVIIRSEGHLGLRLDQPYDLQNRDGRPRFRRPSGRRHRRAHRRWPRPPLRGVRPRGR